MEKLRAGGMALTAYCPLARGRVFGDPTLEAIAARHGKSVSQVALRWLVQQPDVIAIPRSSRPEHARANWEIFDFELSEAEMGKIDALATPGGRLVNVAGRAPAWD
jgi:diketogulonate reductase-like aldo/keto reductase